MGDEIETDKFLVSLDQEDAPSNRQGAADAPPAAPVTMQAAPYQPRVRSAHRLGSSGARPPAGLPAGSVPLAKRSTLPRLSSKSSFGEPSSATLADNAVQGTGNILRPHIGMNRAPPTYGSRQQAPSLPPVSSVGPWSEAGSTWPDLTPEVAALLEDEFSDGQPHTFNASRHHQAGPTFRGFSSSAAIRNPSSSAAARHQPPHSVSSLHVDSQPLVRAPALRSDADLLALLMGDETPASGENVTQDVGGDWPQPAQPEPRRESGVWQQADADDAFFADAFASELTGSSSAMDPRPKSQPMTWPALDSTIVRDHRPVGVKASANATALSSTTAAASAVAAAAEPVPKASKSQWQKFIPSAEDDVAAPRGTKPSGEASRLAASLNPALGASTPTPPSSDIEAKAVAPTRRAAGPLAAQTQRWLQQRRTGLTGADSAADDPPPERKLPPSIASSNSGLRRANLPLLDDRDASETTPTAAKGAPKATQFRVPQALFATNVKALTFPAPAAASRATPVQRQAIIPAEFPSVGAYSEALQNAMMEHVSFVSVENSSLCCTLLR